MTALHDAIDKLDGLRRIPGTWSELRVITNASNMNGPSWSLYCKYGPEHRSVHYQSTDLLEVVTNLETHLGHQGLTPEQPTPTKYKLKRSTS